MLSHMLACKRTVTATNLHNICIEPSFCKCVFAARHLKGRPGYSGAYWTACLHTVWLHETKQPAYSRPVSRFWQGQEWFTHEEGAEGGLVGMLILHSICTRLHCSRRANWALLGVVHPHTQCGRAQVGPHWAHKQTIFTCWLDMPDQSS